MATASAACHGGGIVYYKVLPMSMFLLLLRGLVQPVAAAACSVDAIYSFGDSIADTGNLLREGPVGFFASIGSYPYGQTLRKPTGRCSDGLLIIDYFGTYVRSPCQRTALRCACTCTCTSQETKCMVTVPCCVTSTRAAMALNLSLVSPYLDKGADFASGANFAVAGATALDGAVLLQSGIMAPPASVPLSSQLDWFKAHLNATACPSLQGAACGVAHRASTRYGAM
jgi:hypothetical protein